MGNRAKARVARAVAFSLMHRRGNRSWKSRRWRGAHSGDRGGGVHWRRAVARAGARRFVYLSSIVAMGAATTPGRPFRADDEPRPESPYGHSKLATEEALKEAARDTGIELSIIRPPLVYGPGVRANFRALLRLVASGVPLPFAAIDNRRSFINADNLTDLIAVSALHPAAPGQVPA